MASTSLDGLCRVFQVVPICVLNQKPTPQAEAFKRNKQASSKEEWVHFSVLPLSSVSPGGFALGSPCEPFKYYLFVHYNLVALLDSCPVELKARCFGGSLFRRKLKVVSSFRFVCCHSRAGGYGGTVSQPLLPVCFTVGCFLLTLFA